MENEEEQPLMDDQPNGEMEGKKRYRFPPLFADPKKISNSEYHNNTGILGKNSGFAPSLFVILFNHE
jgi:hypothetical protein